MLVGLAATHNCIRVCLNRGFLTGGPWTPRGSVDGYSGVRGTAVSFFENNQKKKIRLKFIPKLFDESAGSSSVAAGNCCIYNVNYFYCERY